MPAYQDNRATGWTPGGLGGHENQTCVVSPLRVEVAARCQTASWGNPQVRARGKPCEVPSHSSSHAGGNASLPIRPN